MFVNIIKKFKKYKWIFVDEFQMTPDFILPYLFIIKQECGCKFILSGDFNQWGPIECSYDIDNIAVSKLYDGNVYEIYGNQRIIDKDYVDALTYKDFREAIKQCSYKEKTKYTITYYSRPDIVIGSHKQNIKAYKHFTGLKYITKKIKSTQI